MQKIFNYPSSLENKRVNDADMGNAYNMLSSVQRAHMKNGIAFSHFLYKEQVNTHQTIVNDHSKGYMYSLKTEPIAWTVLFFTHKYLSAPRLIAALMPALLAKVPVVLAISLNGLPSNNSLTALELMGIEDIFCTNNKPSHFSSPDEALNIINSMQKFNEHGRVLFLHNNELSTIVQCALEHDIVFWQENKPPKIAVQENCTYTKEYLSWAHPDVFCSGLNYHYNNANALLCTQDFYTKNQNSLSNIELFLFEGMEGCWSHSNLKPEFFQQTTMVIGNSTI